MSLAVQKTRSSGNGMPSTGPRTMLAIYAHVIDSRAAEAADSIGAKIAAAMAGKAKSRTNGE